MPNSSRRAGSAAIPGLVLAVIAAVATIVATAAGPATAPSPDKTDNAGLDDRAPAG